MTIHQIEGVVAEPLCEHVSAYDWATPYIAAIAAKNEDLRPRILAMPRAELHFIAMTLALMGDKRDDADHRGAFACAYGTLTRKTLLQAMAPDAHSGLVKVTAKLRGGVWPVRDYVLLGEMFHDEQARKTLRHRKTIRRKHVRRLAGLPKGYRTQGVLGHVYAKSDLASVIFAIRAVNAIRPTLGDKAVLKSLENTDDCMRDWVLKHLEHAPFPAAPVGAVKTGDGEIVPLEDYAALATAARDFKNCIRTYLMRVLRGDSYFYRYHRKGDDKSAAIVELKRAPVLGWVAHETYGASNSDVKPRDRAAILSALANAGVGAAPQAVDPDAWFALE